MTIDWGNKRGLAIAFNSNSAPELEDYHPKPDGYHFVKIEEDTSDPADVTFSMLTSNVDIGVTTQPGEGHGWSAEAREIIESLKLRRDDTNPDVLVGAPGIDVSLFGWKLTHWKMELQDVELPTGAIMEVAVDTLTWQRQRNGVPSDLNGDPLADGQPPIYITTSWIWDVID